MVLLRTFPVAFLILSAGCRQESEEISSVYFTDSYRSITSDELMPVTLTLGIDPPSSDSSYILVSLTSGGGDAGTAFSVSPKEADGIIEIPVKGGESAVSLVITPEQEGIGFSNIIIDLEIISTGKGLVSGGLRGVFSSLFILNREDQTRTLPFYEAFDPCDSPSGTGGLPAGWEERVSLQNSVGTARWVCSPAFEGIECNAYSDSGGPGDSSEVWLITPPVDLTGSSSPELSFRVDRRFETAGFQAYDVKISTDYEGGGFYDGAEIEPEDWEVFRPAVDAIEANDPGRDNYETVSSLDLSAYRHDTIHLAFIYRAEGSRLTSTILRLDEFRIEDQKK